ncbi:YihY/virulence factor BrkB family protein [Halochromatium roseum]|uniref:YihY/virulence factor BrkB family protein n=1 Tax=Halochromatium roseum TaxID=391920 RepID=UPI0019125033|nr:YihY/virulence factor BrkB family protein [Halochromatium roseum]
MAMQGPTGRRAMLTRVGCLLCFVRRVLQHFNRNRGLLLAGGVGYNILLSIIPLFAVLAVTLSKVVSEEHLLEVIALQARLLTPDRSELLVETLRSLLEQRQLIGWVGFGVMLFFSSLAFRMLDDAVAIIFQRHRRTASRRLWVAALLPYVYVAVLGVALLGLTGLVAFFNTMGRLDLSLLGMHLPLSGAAVFGLWASSFFGVALLFASIYKVLPVVPVHIGRALIGGLVAAALWELIRLALVWWFAKVSMVNLVYGSLGTVVVLLLYLEAAAVILLLGAQVIAELERSAEAGLPWYQEPDRSQSASANSCDSCNSHIGVGFATAPSDPSEADTDAEQRPSRPLEEAQATRMGSSDRHSRHRRA